MSRMLLDDGLRSWEAFASTGPYGYSEHSRVIFRCTSDPSERPRAFAVVGDKSEAEAKVMTASPSELLKMLGLAEPLR